MKLHVNSEVRVVLTGRGSKVFRASLFGVPEKYHPRHAPGDSVTMPLWELFQIFGGEFRVGNLLPFEGNEIEVVTPR